MMLSSVSLGERVREELLPRVREPAQYIGGEINQLVKAGDWERAEIKVAVAFPDTYALGMSHLGCQILYWLCNHTPGVCAERAYCPWIDAEQVMRDRGIPLFTWDTRQPVADADILAISLQYEMCFTNVLNLLDLAGIPVRHEDRMKNMPTRTAVGMASNTGRDTRATEWPLVIVGGPQADSPEPMAEFVDLVVIGDGEHSMASILDACREYKRAGVPRREMIALLAKRFPWIYAPNLYEPSYHADGTLAGLMPKMEGLPARIDRCKTQDFGTAPFPTKPLVPWVQVVHDRLSIEIMRGCPQVCRFCHAGYTKRPLYYRTVDQILAIAEEAYWSTGQHEIGLLSLSTADYPHLAELAEKINERFAPRMVNISLPSLRVDKMLQNIPWMAKSVRKGGLTIAVEAANDDLRAAIRKKVTDGNLLDGVRAAYEAGWNRVKLYFMAGFPGERDADIRGIWELANAVSQERRKTGKGPAQVTASVGWLVPKPFTPFQWMGQPRVEYFLSVRERLMKLSRPGRGNRHGPVVVTGGQGGYGGVAQMREEEDFYDDRQNSGGRWNGRRSQVKIVMHDPYRSILEGVFARGDRRLGQVIYEAWRRGARFDAWDETFVPQTWREAFTATGVDPDFYAHRERSYAELLPWDHIGLHMSRSYLEHGYDDVFQKINVPKPLPVLGPVSKSV